MPPPNAWYRTIAESPLWLRLPLGLVLVAGGVFAILPVLGIWMLPVGLALLVMGSPRFRPYITRSRRWLLARLKGLMARARTLQKKLTKRPGNPSTSR